MKIFKITYEGEGEDLKKIETEVTDGVIKKGEIIHICRHEEGLPCTIV
jgi:hypothetical protein